MDLSIVIVNYNSREKTLNCLKSIYASDLSGVDFEIILIDNGSAEKIEDEIGKDYPKINFIVSKKNLGMGKGNNLGIKAAGGDFILILNPDTIVKPNAVKILYSQIKNNNNIGIAGPKLLNSDGSLQYSCFRQLRFFTPIFRRTFLGRFANKHINNFLMLDKIPQPPLNKGGIMDVDWLMGSCLMVRREVFNKVGFFDERFFMYFEDTDLCRRVWRAGFRVVYFPQAQVIHDHGRGSAEKPWYLAPFVSKLSRAHISSWIKYFLKWGFKIEKFGV